MFVPPPWSVPVMIVVLALVLAVLSGRRVAGIDKGFPTTVYPQNHGSRRMSGRGACSPRLLGALLLQAILVFTFRIVEFPREAWRLPYDFSALPTWQVWSILVLAAFVAAITEEVGFRGYMQVPLEKRYGPVAAIGIVSIVFMVAHLNQAWAGGILIILIVVSVIWGVLARVSDSLIPGIVSHGLADVVNFSYWWTDIAGSFDKRPISETGVDAHFIASSAAVLLLCPHLFIVAARQTRNCVKHRA